MSRVSPADERRRLLAGLQQLKLALDDAQVEALLDYIGLIRRWAGTYNLVAAGDLDALVERHLLDSLAILPWVVDGRLLDVGSGAGFPGLPLAIARPGLQATLLDSSGKRCRFLRHVVRALGLANVEVVNERAETYRTQPGFRVIVSRAFASLALFAERVRHLADGATRVLAIKGRHPTDELQALPGWVTVEAVEVYHVPDLHAERHLVIMSLSP